VDPCDDIEVLAWAVRRRERMEAERDIRMLRGMLNVQVYALDPSLFQDFAEVMDPLMPDWMKEETKKAIAETRRKEAMSRLKRSLNELDRRLGR